MKLYFSWVTFKYFIFIYALVQPLYKPVYYLVDKLTVETVKMRIERIPKEKNQLSR